MITPWWTCCDLCRKWIQTCMWLDAMWYDRTWLDSTRLMIEFFQRSIQLSVKLEWRFMTLDDSPWPDVTQLAWCKHKLKGPSPKRDIWETILTHASHFKIYIYAFVSINNANHKNFDTSCTSAHKIALLIVSQNMLSFYLQLDAFLLVMSTTSCPSFMCFMLIA